MIPFHESSAIDRSEFRRAENAGPMGDGAYPAGAVGAARSNDSNGRRRDSKPGDRGTAEDLTAYRPALARALSCAATAGTGKGRAAPRADPPNLGTESRRRGQGDAAYYPCECDTLEHAFDGRSPRSQRGDDSAYLAPASTQTPPGGNLQAQSRQALHRETGRCGGPVPESSGQGRGVVRRREEPDSSPRSHSATAAFQATGT